MSWLPVTGSWLGVSSTDSVNVNEEARKNENDIADRGDNEDYNANSNVSFVDLPQPWNEDAKHGSHAGTP